MIEVAVMVTTLPPTVVVVVLNTSVTVVSFTSHNPTVVRVVELG
jgi:hypothetical protein